LLFKDYCGEIQMTRDILVDPPPPPVSRIIWMASNQPLHPTYLYLVQQIFSKKAILTFYLCSEKKEHYVTYNLIIFLTFFLSIYSDAATGQFYKDNLIVIKQKIASNLHILVWQKDRMWHLDTLFRFLWT